MTLLAVALFPPCVVAALLLASAAGRILPRTDAAFGLSMLVLGTALYGLTPLSRWPVVLLVAASHLAAWGIIRLRIRRFGR